MAVLPNSKCKETHVIFVTDLKFKEKKNRKKTILNVYAESKWKKLFSDFALWFDTVLLFSLKMLGM